MVYKKRIGFFSGSFHLVDDFPRFLPTQSLLAFFSHCLTLPPKDLAPYFSPVRRLPGFGCVFLDDGIIFSAQLPDCMSERTAD